MSTEAEIRQWCIDRGWPECCADQFAIDLTMTLADPILERGTTVDPATGVRYVPCIPQPVRPARPALRLVR